MLARLQIELPQFPRTLGAQVNTQNRARFNGNALRSKQQIQVISFFYYSRRLGNTLIARARSIRRKIIFVHWPLESLLDQTEGHPCRRPCSARTTRRPPLPRKGGRRQRPGSAMPIRQDLIRPCGQPPPAERKRFRLSWKGQGAIDAPGEDGAICRDSPPLASRGFRMVERV